MIPQMQDDKRQGEEQVSSPVQEKQTAAPHEERAGSTPASPRRWIRVLLPILAVALPLGGGLIWGGIMDIFDEMWLFLTIVLGCGLLAFVGAALLRSWWALVVEPVAWAVGWILGALLIPLIQGGWPALQDTITLIWENKQILVIMLQIASLPLLIGTFLGTVGGITLKPWAKQWQQHVEKSELLKQIAVRTALFILEACVAVFVILSDGPVLTNTMYFPPEWFQGISFGNDIVTALVVTGVIGAISLAAAAAVFIRREWSVLLSAAAGLLLAGFATVQLVMVQSFFWLPVLSLVIGLTVFGLAAFLWMTEYRRQRFPTRQTSHA
jgi:MFS family permease